MTTELTIILNESAFRKKLFQLFIFSAAMALLESAVVVYLRALYYPEGFTVALKLIDNKILFTELLREAATIVMLAAIAIITGRNFIQRFSFFLFCFAVWDIFYYIWLKVLLDWPESFFTWDILFLIPVTWLGPVLAPILCSFTMILLAWSLLNIQQQSPHLKLKLYDWLLLITGSLIILFTFIKDYADIILTNGWILEMDKLMQNAEFIRITSSYIPESYHWGLFMTGEILLLASVGLLWKRNSQYHLKLSNL